MKKTALFSLLALLGAAPAFSQISSAEIIPGLVNYQGLLTDDSGVPLGNTAAENVTLAIRVYDAPSAGALLHSEQQVTSVNQGQFSVLVGLGDPIPNEVNRNLAELFNSGNSSEFHLEVSVTRNGTTEVIPSRQKIIATPFALRAKVAESVAPGAISSNSLADGTALRIGAGEFRMTSAQEANLDADSDEAFLTFRNQGVPSTILSSAENLFQIRSNGANGTNATLAFSATDGLKVPDQLEVTGSSVLKGAVTLEGNVIAQGPLTTEGELRVANHIHNTAPNSFLRLNTPRGAELRYNADEATGIFDFNKAGNLETRLESSADGFFIENNQGDERKTLHFRNDGDLIVPEAVIMGPSGAIFSGEEQITFQTDPDGQEFARLEYRSHDIDTRLLTMTGASGAAVEFGSDVGRAFVYSGNGDSKALLLGSSWSISSDERLKKNIEKETGILDRALKINPVTFHFKSQTEDEAKSLGVIAQNVRESFPELVHEDSEGGLSVAYGALSVVALGAIQEQQVEIQELRAQNEALTNRLKEIEEALKRLDQ